MLDCWISRETKTEQEECEKLKQDFTLCDPCKATPASPQTCALIEHLQGCLRKAYTTFLCGEVQSESLSASKTKCHRLFVLYISSSYLHGTAAIASCPVNPCFCLCKLLFSFLSHPDLFPIPVTAFLPSGSLSGLCCFGMPCECQVGIIILIIVVLSQYLSDVTHRLTRQLPAQTAPQQPLLQRI